MNNKKLQDSDQERDGGNRLKGHVEKKQHTFTVINPYPANVENLLSS
jgi:hypothetical protein